MKILDQPDFIMLPRLKTVLNLVHQTFHEIDAQTAATVMSHILTQVGWKNFGRVEFLSMVHNPHFKIALRSNNGNHNFLVWSVLVRMLDDVCASLIDSQRDVGNIFLAKSEFSRSGRNKIPHFGQMARLAEDSFCHDFWISSHALVAVYDAFTVLNFVMASFSSL